MPPVHSRDEAKRRRQAEDDERAYELLAEDMGEPAADACGAGTSRFHRGERVEALPPSEPRDASAALGDAPADDDAPRPPRGRGAMTAFLDELQRCVAPCMPLTDSAQAMREERLRPQVGAHGTRDTSARSTNLCVRNLPADSTEDAIGAFFAQWGDVAAVALHADDDPGIPARWRDRQGGMCAFVAYMRHAEADAAQRASDGAPWGSGALKTTWARSVALPPHPQFPKAAAVRPRGRQHARSASPTFVRHRTGRRGRDAGTGRGDAEGGYGAHGAGVADAPKSEERTHAHGGAVGADYDTFADVPAGARLPTAAEYAALHSTDSAEVSEQDRLRQGGTAVLGVLAQRRLRAMLQHLTPRRERVARCMALALDHAYAADAIAAVISRSLWRGCMWCRIFSTTARRPCRTHGGTATRSRRISRASLRTGAPLCVGSPGA
ncbi:hypothetical protein MSPP1_003216 [Malassezia sp. CBS 17886]|nr:hypothetical protein MSPP1_003216 [Malassezia sp. CBS 17886]